MTTGNIGFFEIHVDDFQRAQTFYSNVFGWKFSKSDSVPYEFYMLDNINSKKGDMGLQEGGMRKREQPVVQGNAVLGSVCYILVEKIDEILEKIVKYGGKVKTPKALIPAGYFSYAIDTEENIFGVWEVTE